MDNFDWKQLINPEFYIAMELGGVSIGLYVVLFIVFAETGLFAGFFLPGDSLLFLAGIYSRELIENLVFIENDFGNVALLSTLVALSGIIGNTVGYWFGAKSGWYLYKKEDSFWFKKKYLEQSRVFFEKYGGKAIIIARFMPVLRTFAPIIAGIVQMDKKRFMFYNILSSFLWAFSLIMAGHYLYGLFLSKFDIDLKKHIEIIILIIVAATTIPLVVKFLKGNKETPENNTEE
ncbi:membrane-associated protein [Flavobacterium gossypii]|uniref:Membrane-associated protein n=1 Tax=Flavobacterium gossypii TaxID=1646119 RepID=A0ABR6DNC5_9FLAO|nr:VTT domain-containing protein [Flavobacterium gossypii]MBA9073200.1 membrane-associated protein [Flavobacterium gossypii]